MAGNGESLSKDLTAEEFGRFRDYVHEHSGIYLEDQKSDSLRISLITRATRFGFGSLQEYYDLLTGDDEEFKELMNLVTINETSFFRFPAQFEALRSEVVPLILEHKPSSARQFRVWSAGCSTGEEPYTTAMTLLDAGLEPLGYDLEVLGTDVSTNALLRAKQGVYPARSLLGIPQSVSSRFFEATPSGHRVTDQVRDIVTFQYHNLIKEPYPLALMGNWDVIFCRNVTIYFRLESTRRVVDNFFESLNPGGFLFIGHSETLTSISERFQPVEIGGVFLYRKPLPRRLHNFADAAIPRGVDRSARAKTRPAAREQRATREPPRPRRRPAPEPDRPKPEPAEEPVAASDDLPVGVSEVDALLDAARAGAFDGHADAVLEAVGRVLQLDPDRAEAYLLSAYAHADLGDLDTAIEECHRALDLEPLLAAARYILGVIHLRLGDEMRAISEFKKTLYIDRGFVLAHFNLANLYRARGSMSESCREYENTLQMLYENPEGDWVVFMGGFRSDLLAKTCERSLVECRKDSG